MPIRLTHLNRPLILLIILSSLALRPTHAQSLERLIQEAAQSGALTTTQSQQFQTLTSAVSKLAGLEINHSNIAQGTISGDIEFLNRQWKLLAFSDGANNTLLTFAPKQVLKFKDLVGSAPGVELLDVIAFDQQLFVFALQDFQLSAQRLPEDVRSVVDRFADSPQSEIAFSGGLTQLGTFNLSDVTVLNNAIQFLGGDASQVHTRTVLKGGDVLDHFLNGRFPEPQINLSATMPTFRPTIGGKLTLPTDLKMKLVGELKGKQASLDYQGTTALELAGQAVDMNLETAITLQAGAPEFTVTASTFKGAPWQKAFGVSWLTIEDYRITFGQEADALKVGFGGKTRIGEKQFEVLALTATSVKTLGVPIPEKIQLSIDDGPDKVGSLTLRDIAFIFVEMLKAGGQGVTLPSAFPDLAITGTEKGKGPSVSVVLKAAGSAGMDISGALRVLGTQVGVIERAFVQADSGVEIKAHTADLAVGPIRFPTADVDVSLKSDGLNLTEPRAIIKAKALSLFGSENDVSLIMRPTHFELMALSDFGSLFKFNLLARTHQPINTLQQLEQADFQLAASLSSDLSEWIRTEGVRAVEQFFGGRRLLDSAEQSLKEAQVSVATLDDNISAMKAQMSEHKLSGAAQVQAVIDEVNKLHDEIEAVQSQVSRRNADKQTCKTFVSLPDAQAIAECMTANGKLNVEVAGLETAKGILIASRTVAETALSTLRKGVENIPVELDPRVSGLIVAREAAMLTLKSAQEVVKGMGALSGVLAEGVAVLAKPDIFALEKSSIRGSLRGAVQGQPSVLDMNFRLLGERYQQRLAFSLTDMAFNARQFEVIALGAAVNTVMKLGRQAMIIPPSLLAEVQGIYDEKRLLVDAELDRAIALNPLRETF